MEYTTVDRDEIRKAVERFGGRPSILFLPDADGENGILDFIWGGRNHPELQEITWNEFFDEFERRNLAFRYIERGDTIDYSFVGKDAVEDDETVLPDNEELAEQNSFSSLESNPNLDVHPEESTNRVSE